MKSKILSRLGITYFLFGLIFATFYAIYYKWVALAFLSPGFYAVLITWPYQAIGLINDLLIYGLAGKPS
jgi:hypothetical protein